MSRQLTYAEQVEVFRRFRAANAHPKGELEHLNAFTLLVAVALSAQATDASVNKATRDLFPIADTPERMLALGEEGLIPYIQSIGLYRNKARNVIQLSRLLVEHFGGEVPSSRAALESLPGVGRKTANVVLNMWWGFPSPARGHPRLPRRQPHRDRHGRRRRRGRTRAREPRPRGVPAALAPLADPARPLHLRRAQAANARPA